MDSPILSSLGYVPMNVAQEMWPCRVADGEQGTVGDGAQEGEPNTNIVVGPQVPAPDVEREPAFRPGDGRPRGPCLGGAQSLLDEPHSWRGNDGRRAPANRHGACGSTRTTPSNGTGCRRGHFTASPG